MNDVNSTQPNSATVVTLTGSINTTTAPGVASTFAERIAQGQVRLVADLSGVDYTSSAGLRALLGALKECRQAGGDLRLAAAQPVVLKVLELSGFTSILKHFPDVGSALASFAN